MKHGFLAGGHRRGREALTLGRLRGAPPKSLTEFGTHDPWISCVLLGEAARCHSTSSESAA